MIYLYVEMPFFYNKAYVYVLEFDWRHTFVGLSISITCVTAGGGRNGLLAGNSTADGGSNFSLSDCKPKQIG